MKPDIKLTDAEITELAPMMEAKTSKADDKQTKSHADRLVELVLTQGIELFHDQYGTTFARLNRNGYGEILKCEGREFCRWMAGLYWRQQKKAINSEAIRAATNVLSSQARFDEQEYQLQNRVALRDGEIWYDLTDAKWRAVRITRHGWDIVNDPPILFRRYNHQSAQVDPVSGGSLRDLLRFTNLANEAQELLLQLVLVSYLVADIPHPVLIVHGPQGSAKTTHLRMLRRLVDPSKTETLSLPYDKGELVQQLSHHYAPAYDNVSHLPEWISDALCRATTGEGHSKRELYTDDDDIIYQFRRCISLNGINVAAQKPDLLGRSILVRLRSIPDERRRTEDAYYREFEEARSSLLGAMLDTLSRAMALVDDIKLSRLPRMADFCRWGCAIAEVTGFGHKAFLNAFHENVGLGHEEAIAGSQVAHAIQCLMQNRESWEGTPQTLYRELEDVAEKEGLNTRSKDWPKAANALVRRLNELSPNLGVFGLNIETGSRTGKRREVSIHRMTGNTVTTVTSSPSLPISLMDNHLPNRDDSDDISGMTSAGDDRPLPEAVPPKMLASKDQFSQSQLSGEIVPRPHRQTGGQVCATCHPPADSDWMAPVRIRLAEIWAQKHHMKGNGETSCPDET